MLAALVGCISHLKYFTSKGTLTVRDPLMNQQEDWFAFKATTNKSFRPICKTQIRVLPMSRRQTTINKASLKSISLFKAMLNIIVLSATVLFFENIPKPFEANDLGRTHARDPKQNTSLLASVCTLDYTAETNKLRPVCMRSFAYLSNPSLWRQS